jgi:hypothetical protein
MPGFTDFPRQFGFGVDAYDNFGLSGRTMPDTGFQNISDPNNSWFNSMFGDGRSSFGGFANFGKGLSGLANIGMAGIQGWTGLQQANLAKKQLNLAKQQFAYQKGLANRNLANQASIINTGYDNAAQVAAGMTGSFGKVTPGTVTQYMSDAQKKHVDGSPI